MACPDHESPDKLCPRAGPCWVLVPRGLEQEQVNLSGSLPLPLVIPTKPEDLGGDGECPRLREEGVSRGQSWYLKIAPQAGPPEWGCPGHGTNLGSPDLLCPPWGQSCRHLTSRASSSNTTT